MIRSAKTKQKIFLQRQLFRGCHLNKAMWYADAHWKDVFICLLYMECFPLTIKVQQNTFPGRPWNFHSCLIPIRNFFWVTLDMKWNINFGYVSKLSYLTRQWKIALILGLYRLLNVKSLSQEWKYHDKPKKDPCCILGQNDLRVNLCSRQYPKNSWSSELWVQKTHYHTMKCP